MGAKVTHDEMLFNHADAERAAWVGERAELEAALAHARATEARERARAERGGTAANIVLADSAHAAFHKAAYDFGLEVRKVPVGADFRADPTAMAERVDEQTALVVGSAPQYPQGVIDPIPDLAELAATVGASMHVDACMGGFVLPFMEMNGEVVPPWDFRVAGVTTISADVHKLGYAPKGASVILHRTKELRAHQTFVFDDWLGGFYASSGLLGTRAAGPIAAAWAVIHFLGEAGQLADQMAILHKGRLRAAGRPAELAAELCPGLRVEIGLPASPRPQTEAGDILPAPASGDPVPDSLSRAT